MTKQTNLSLAKVKKVSKEMEKTKVHIIEEGEYAGEQITFQPIFDNVKIEDLLTEFGQLLSEADEKELSISQSNQIHLIHLLTIKYFTHFKNDLPSSLLGQNKKPGLLDTLEHFRKTGLQNECINNMFLPNEISKVYERMTDMAAVGLLSNDLDKIMLEKYQDLQIKNSQAFEQIENLNVQ